MANWRHSEGAGSGLMPDDIDPLQAGIQSMSGDI
jgi:hypothetical protein